jgi:hypothetical protein
MPDTRKEGELGSEQKASKYDLCSYLSYLPKSLDNHFNSVHLNRDFSGDSFVFNSLEESKKT